MSRSAVHRRFLSELICGSRCAHINDFGARSAAATIGLYAALSFSVGQRLREIAIRMALGAAPAQLGALVLRQGVVLVAIGVAAGLLAAGLAGLCWPVSCMASARVIPLL